MKTAITWGAAGLIAFAGCAQRPRTDPSVITIAVFASPNNFDPRVGTDEVSQKVYQLVPSGSFLIQLVLPVIPAGAGPELRNRPIGTGPYKFASYAVDDRLDLTAFSEYYDGPPKNAGVVLKIVPDEIMRGLEPKKGTVDVVVNDISPDTVQKFRDDGSMQIAAAPGTDYAYVGLNLRDPLLADKRIRHAIGYAIDRDAIIKHLRRGLAQPAASVVPPTSWAYAPDAFQFTYDPVRARTLLDEANYCDPDGDGPLPRLHLTLKVSTNEFYRLQAAVIQQDLRAVGIDLDVRSYEFATLSKDVASGNFQLVTLQWVGISDPDMLRRVFHSKQMPPLGFNRGFYSNPEVDRLIDEATAAADLETRKRAYQEVQRRVAEDAPYVSLWYKTNVAVAQHELTGIRLTPLAAFSFLKDVTRRETATRASR